MMLSSPVRDVDRIRASAGALRWLGWRRPSSHDDGWTFACNTPSKARFCLEMLTLLEEGRIDEATLVPIGVLPDSWIGATGRRPRTAAVHGTRRAPGHDRASNSQLHWPCIYGGYRTSARTF